MPVNHLNPGDLSVREPLTTDEVARLMSGATFPWWIAGGWAIDLTLGHQTRPHSDIEIAVLRRDETKVRSFLEGWEIWYADGPGSGLDRLAKDAEPGPGIHELWLRRSATSPWQLELLLEDSHAGEWCYRRDRKVRLPLEAIGQTAGGLPVLRPEIALLYKSKAPRERDDSDFQAMVPALSAEARKWLEEAIGAAHPDSRWLAELEER